jgi:hypothetical protein
METDPPDSREPPIVQPWLQIECGESSGVLQAQEAAMLRDQLRSTSDPPGQRLAEVVDSAVTVLLASPLHAGTRRIRASEAERSVLLEALHVLQQSPLDRYAELRRELES